MPPKSKKKKVQEEEEDLPIEEQEKRRQSQQQSKEKEKLEKEQEEREKTVTLQRSTYFLKQNKNFKFQAESMFQKFRAILKEFERFSDQQMDETIMGDYENMKQKFINLQEFFRREILNPNSQYNENIVVLEGIILSLQKKVIKEGIIKSASILLEKLESRLKLSEEEVVKFERENLALLQQHVQTLKNKERIQREQEKEAEKEKAQELLREQSKRKPISDLSATGLHAKQVGWIFSEPSFLLERFEVPKIFVHALNENAKSLENVENPDVYVYQGVTFYQPSATFYENFCRETQMQNDQVIQQLDKQFEIIYVNKKGQVYRHTPRVNFLKNVNCTSEFQTDEVKENFVKNLVLMPNTLPEMTIIEDYIHRHFELPLTIVSKIMQKAMELIELQGKPMPTVEEYFSFLSKNFLTFLRVLQKDTNYKRRLLLQFNPELLSLSVPEKVKLIGSMGSESEDRLLFQYLQYQADEITFDLLDILKRKLFGSSMILLKKIPRIPKEDEIRILQTFQQIPLFSPSSQPCLSQVQKAETAPSVTTQFELFYFIDQAIAKEQKTA